MSSKQSQNRNPLTQGEYVYDAPLEQAFTRVVDPIDDFVHRQSTSGMLLMLTAIVALLVANSALAPWYESLLQTQAGFRIGEWELSKDIHHWINDGLMALFFFVVGLELKRELFVGELARLDLAILPISAALGGIIVPALIYTGFNWDQGTLRGWGIPMATDIAFAIGALALLGSRVPKALLTFLIALAIVDDLAAVLVIALFYTEDIALQWLLLAALVTVLLLGLNMAGVRRIIPYFSLALVLWFAMLQSGVHATLAGVIGAFTVPARPKYDPAVFSQLARDVLDKFDQRYQENRNIILNSRLNSLVNAMESGVVRVQPPLLRLESMWHIPVSFLVLPVFALANAGVPLNAESFAAALHSPVTQGIVFGLVLGKLMGIWGACWLVLRLGVAKLPPDVTLSHIGGVAMLAGIGFTMSIFISELAFSGMRDTLLQAKTGILLASLIAGLSGFIWLFSLGKPDKD